MFQDPKHGINEVIQAADTFFTKYGLNRDRISTEVYWKLFDQFNSTVILIPWIRFFMSIGLEMFPADISLYNLFDELCFAYRWKVITSEVFHLGLELCVVEFGLFIDIPSPDVESVEQRRKILSKKCNRNSTFITVGLEPNSDSGFEVDPENMDDTMKFFQLELYESYHLYRGLYFKTSVGKLHFQEICEAVRSYFVFETDAFDAITPLITEFLFGSAKAIPDVTRTFPSSSPLTNPLELSPMQLACKEVSREVSTLSDVGNFFAC